MNRKEILEVLEGHELWLKGKEGKRANLSGADLGWANLSGANLSGANLNCIKINGLTGFICFQCPEKGSYRAYKKARDNFIVELEIPEDALRSSGTSRKCRASKARVISITNIDRTKCTKKIGSIYDPEFIYEVGETAEVLDFDTDRWNECAAGIHHFITRAEAENYS